MEPDDRQYDRTSTKLEVTLVSELDGTLRGTVEDVGVGGLFVRCVERLPVGTLCELFVQGVGPDGDRTLEASGRVAHVAEHGMGIQITELAAEHDELLRQLASGDDAL